MASNSAKEAMDAEFEEFLNEPLTSSEDGSSAKQNKINLDESKGNKWLKRSNAAVQNAEEDSSIPDVTEEELRNILGEINSADISLSTPTLTGLYSEDFDQEEEEEVVKDAEEEEDSVAMKGEEEEAVGGLESFQTVILNDAEVGENVKAKPELLVGPPATRSLDEIMKEVVVLERLSRTSEREDPSPNDKLPRSSSSADARLRLQLQEERRQNSKLRAEFSAQETNVKKNLDDLRSAYEEKIFRLQEENIVLSSRLEELGRGTDVGKSGDDGREVSAEIRAEKAMDAMKEQERILAGYQTENERLYAEVKKLNALAKEKEKFWNDRCAALRSETLTRRRRSSKAEDAEDDSDLAAKDLEIGRLTERIAALNAGARTSNLKTDGYRKKMEEMKDLFAAKHPDSVAALVIAANLSDWDPLERETKSVASSEGRDNDLSRLQDEYLRVKVVYEKRIEGLERKVKDLEGGNGPNEPRSSLAAALEKELDGCRKRHEKEVSALRCQVERLRNESRKNRWGNSPPKPKGQSDAEERERVDLLKGQIETLRSRLEIADKEKRQISRTRKDDEELMDNLRAAQRKEREELESELGRWFAKAADYKSQLDSREETISALREQLSRESFALREQVAGLTEEKSSLRRRLRQASRNATPQQERINEMKSRLEELEDKYAEKEDELRKIRSRVSRPEEEVSSWKRKAWEKNDEVRGFRSELDGILKVLEEMRRRGVRVPVTETMLRHLR